MPDRHPPLSPAADALLRLLAFTAAEPFPLPALCAASDTLPAALAALADPCCVDQVEVELADAGLLVPAATGALLRAEVAEEVRRGLGEEAEGWAAAAARAVAAAYPPDPERPEQAAAAEALLPHALRAAAWCAPHGEGARAAGHCLLSAGRTLLASGDAPAAREALSRSVMLLEASRGPQHPAVALALTYLNGALSSLGERGPMLENAHRALAILEAAHGPAHPEVVVHVNNVGTLLRTAGDLEGAIPYFLRAMELSEGVFGPAHPLTATLHGNLGETLHRLGRPGDARPHLARALATDEAAYGPAHPSVARDLHRLARVLAELGERGEAQGLMQRAIDYLQPAAGEDDPRVRLIRADIRALEG